MRRTMIGIVVLSLGLMAGNCDAAADTVDQYYQGKTISWIVASEPGSPTDLIARTFAPFLAKETGARIRVEAMNTDEGINHVYKQGTRDGLTLGSKATDAIIGNEILKSPGVQYETEKLNFIADIYPAVKIFQLSPKLPYRTLDALRKAKGLRAGGTTRKGSIATSTAVMLEILGLDAKLITGFPGAQNLALAMARGEVDCRVMGDSTAMRDEKDGYVFNFVTVSEKKSAALPLVPALPEIGVKVPRDLAAVHKFITTGGIALVMPPGVPPERIEYLRRVFQNLSNNRELQKAMEKLTGASKGFVSGKDLQQEMAEIKADTEMAVKLDALFKKYSAVQ